MLRRCADEAIVIDFRDAPWRFFTREQGDHFDELPEAHLRIQAAELCQSTHQWSACLGAHGSLSPTVGKRARSSFGRVSITSTLICWPGSSLPTRVDRVTPSMSCNSPFLPRTTSGDGIPSILLPCWEICFASLAGSAPPIRPGGRRSVRGSTWMNSRCGPAGCAIPHFPPKPSSPQRDAALLFRPTERRDHAPRSPHCTPQSSWSEAGPAPGEPGALSVSPLFVRYAKGS